MITVRTAVRRRRVSRDEQGAALMMALLVLTVVGLLLAATLTYTDTSVRVGRSVQEDSVALYAAEGVVDATIQTLRDDGDLGRDGGACPETTLATSDGRTAVLRCDPVAGSGAERPGSGPDGLAWGLVTTATVASGEDGVVLAGPNAELGIDGPVFSHSTVRVAHGGSLITTIVGDGPGYPVRAIGGCDAGRVVSEPAPACDLGAAAAAEGDVAALFPTPLTALPERRAVPACPGRDEYVALAPGWYDDAAALERLTASGCGAVVHFLPGVHYLDFAGSDTQWDVSDRNVSVVGGTPQGWAPGTVPPADGACAPDAPGALFVLGGESRLRVEADTAFEVCGAENATGQRVAFHGLTSVAAGGEGSTSTTVHPTSQQAPITGSGTPFAPGLRAVDGQVNTGNVNGKNKTGSVTLTGYQLPAGTATDAVTLRMAHRHVQNPGNALTWVRVRVLGSGFSCTVTLSPQSSLTVEEKPVPCLAGRTSFAGVRLVYEARTRNTGNPSAQIDLDGLDLVVGSTTPGLRPQSGCVTEVGGCPVIAAVSQGAGNRPVVLVRGTVYVPAGLVDLDFKNNTVVRFERGLIARALRVDGIPPSELVGAISLPTDGGGRDDRAVELVVEVDGRRQLRVVVHFDDGGGATPGREVDVLEWDAVDP